GTFSLLDVVDDGIQLVDGRVGLLVELIAGDKFADAALAIAHIRGDGLELVERRIQAVIESRVINKLSDGALAALHEGNDAVEALYQSIHVLQSALAGTDNVGEVRVLTNGKLIPFLNGRPLSLRAIDINIGFSQNASRFHRGHRVFAKGLLILGGDLHGDFHWSQLFFRHDPDTGDIADIDPL